MNNAILCCNLFELVALESWLSLSSCRETAALCPILFRRWKRQMACFCLVQDKLNSLRSGQTTVIVAHRLSTVMDADIIICMQVSTALSAHTALCGRKRGS